MLNSPKSLTLRLDERSLNTLAHLLARTPVRDDVLPANSNIAP